MIVHLSAAGVPVSWTIVALYRGSYGIACNSARTWHERSLAEDRHRDTPQFVVELKENGDGTWNEMRAELWMDEANLKRQSPDDRQAMVQEQTAPVPLPDTLIEAISTALKRHLTGFGYLIPRDAWHRRYPAQALIAKRFADFNEAAGAARAAGRDLAFDTRWIMFMEAPEDTHLPYSVGFVTPAGALEEHDMGGSRPVVVMRPDERSLWTRFDHPALPPLATADDARSAMRLLNSGWTPEEVRILLGDEPLTA